MPADPADLLRQRGYRVTGQRLAVLRAVSAEPHVTAEAVAETVRAGLGAISLQAVYDVLAVLADVGLVRRNPARRVTGPLRGPGQRQPPPRDLP